MLMERRSPLVHRSREGQSVQSDCDLENLAVVPRMGAADPSGQATVPRARSMLNSRLLNRSPFFGCQGLARMRVAGVVQLAGPGAREVAAIDMEFGNLAEGLDLGSEEGGRSLLRLVGGPPEPAAFTPDS